MRGRASGEIFEDGGVMAIVPKFSLLVKLGSIAVHADELLDQSPNAVRGHEHDTIAIKSLLSDPEVSQWIANMTKIGMLPVKR